MPTTHYYYEKEGVAAGPRPADELVAHGVNQQTLVWAEGMAAWQAAGQLAGLAKLFAVLPPPLPSRPSPPPLPISARQPPLLVEVSNALPIAGIALPSLPLFPASGYSIPLLGVFKNDNDVYAMDSGELFASFAEDDETNRLTKGGLQRLKQYQFTLRNPAGETLLLLEKPKESFFNPLNVSELHVFDGSSQRLAICRFKISLTIKTVITVEDAKGRLLMKVNALSIAGRQWELEMRGKVIGKVQRSKEAGWTQMFLVHQNDRFELIFEPGVTDRVKAIGISAVIALHFFATHKW